MSELDSFQRELLADLRATAEKNAEGLTAYRKRRRRYIAIGAVAAATATIVSFQFGISASADRAAAAVLERAGVSAKQQPGGWPDAAYWRSVSRYGRKGHACTRQTWIAHHGRSVLLDPGVSATPFSLGQVAFPAGSTTLTWDELYTLPTDPAQLRPVLASRIQGAGPDPDSEMFTVVGDLLRESPASPALRSALFNVAAKVPGTTLVGSTTDPIGRPGVAVRRGDTTYVVDPARGELLAETYRDYSTTYLQQGPTKTAPLAQGPTAPTCHVPSDATATATPSPVETPPVP